MSMGAIRIDILEQIETPLRVAYSKNCRISQAALKGNHPTVFRVLVTKKGIDPKKRGKEYGFGFNGMERDDEVKGAGSVYTTEFRINDPRLGGRWFSPDRVIKPYEGPYVGYQNNPIFYSDPSGLDVHEDCNTGQVYHVPDGSADQGTEGVDWEFISHGEMLEQVDVTAPAPEKFTVSFPTPTMGTNAVRNMFTKDEINRLFNKNLKSENPYDKYQRLVNEWGEDRVQAVLYESYVGPDKGVILEDPTTDMMVVAPFEILAKMGSGSAALKVATFEESTITANTSLLSKASTSAFEASEDASSIFIKDKHLASAGGQWSKFATTDKSVAQKWVQQALRSPKARILPNAQLPNTFQIVTDLGTAVGTKGETTIKAIVGFDGKVINAFPVKF